MSSGETRKKISTSEVCFLCKVKVSSEEKIKVFGKSSLEIHKVILRSTEVDLSAYVGSDSAVMHLASPNVIIVCFATRGLWTK